MFPGESLSNFMDDLEDFPLTSLNLAKNNLGIPITEALRTARISASLASLNLRRNDLRNAEQLDYLAEGIRDLKKLTSLHLGQNAFGDSGAMVLSRKMLALSLTSLNLAQCGIGDQGAKYLEKALKQNTSLLELHLTKNNIGDKGAKYLANSLRKNSSLQILRLAKNTIRDEGAKRLADVLLRENSSLKELRLAENNISEEGTKALHEVLADSSLRCSIDLTGIPRMKEKWGSEEKRETTDDRAPDVENMQWKRMLESKRDLVDVLAKKLHPNEMRVVLQVRGELSGGTNDMRDSFCRSEMNRKANPRNEHGDSVEGLSAVPKEIGKREEKAKILKKHGKDLSFWLFLEWPKKELRALLRSAGLSTSGSKYHLISLLLRDGISGM